MLFEKTRFRFTKAFFCLLLLIGSQCEALAANVVDPNSVGATDVYAGGLPLYLFTPLPDQLDLLDFDLTVGDAALGEFRIDDGSFVSNGNSVIGKQLDGTGAVTVTGTNSKWQTNGDLTIGNLGSAILNVREGGTLTSQNAYLGIEGGKSGAVVLSGMDTTWINDDSITIGSGSIELNNHSKILTNKLVTHQFHPNGISESLILIREGAELSGYPSFTTFPPLTLPNPIYTTEPTTNSIELIVPEEFVNSNLEVELNGYSRLDLSGGGKLYSQSASLLGNETNPRRRGSIQVNLNHEGTVWSNAGNLTLQQTRLSIANSARLSSYGTLAIGEGSNAYIYSGQFDFGVTDPDSFNRIHINGGKVTGRVVLTGFNDMEEFSGYNISSSADVTSVKLLNEGVLYGDGSTRLGLYNSYEGQVFVNGYMEFMGISENHGEISLVESGLEFRNHLTNRGNILNANGSLTVEGDLTNTEIIEGRGEFRTAGTLYNSGHLKFNGGESRVFGEVSNQFVFLPFPYQTYPVIDPITISSAPRIDVFDEALVFFYNKVYGGGIINVEAGSTARFLNGFEGNNVTGEGYVRLAGKVSPGKHSLYLLAETVPFDLRAADPEIGGITHPLPDPTITYYPWEYYQTGQMTFGGDVRFESNANVELTISGYGFNDRIDVAGRLELNGILNLNLIGSELLEPQDTFTLITAGEIVGSLGNVVGLELDGPLEWEFLQTETEISVTAYLPGDFNNDWTVDAGDYTVWRDIYANQDRRIAALMYQTWTDNFGLTFTGPGEAGNSAAQAIPEPSSILLMLCVSLLATSRWRLMKF